MIALAAMWAYDLHLYTVAYFTRGLAPDLFALRGAVLAMIVPLFALGLRHDELEGPDVARRDLPVGLGDRDPDLPDRDDVALAGDGDRRRRLGPGRARSR